MNEWNPHTLIHICLDTDNGYRTWYREGAGTSVRFARCNCSVLGHKSRTERYDSAGAQEDWMQGVRIQVCIVVVSYSPLHPSGLAVSYVSEIR
jgi:hypothetical protein